MAVQKSERLLNLLIMLLVQRHYVSKDRIRSILYPDSSTDAFEKMFERDKEELRSLGVPIEVGNMDAYFDDEPGYRIRPDQFALPDISLTADEAAVIGLATRVWEHARLAEATTEAVRKLTALGRPARRQRPRHRRAPAERRRAVVRRLLGGGPGAHPGRVRLPPLRRHRRPRTRHLQPWGVVRYSGRWYVVGLDTDRGEERVFRLSRVQGEARKVGQPGSYDVPPGTDVRATDPPPRAGAADRRARCVLVRDGAGLALRRDAESVETGVPGPDDAHRLGPGRAHPRRPGCADELLGYGADVYVEEPGRAAPAARATG